METISTRTDLPNQYEQAAQRYMRSLTPEHYMEATPQGTQRKITLESFDLVNALRPDIQTFNELLVQYPRTGRKKLGQVVPDNMVVISPEPIHAVGSFALPEQPVRPFMMLEYVSKSSERKDYEDNFDRYEQELKVPYYLLFYPDSQDLTLYHHTGKRYQSVKPNEEGRLAIPELELEVAILHGWVRYWFRGNLLPLPAALMFELEETKRLLKEESLQLGREKQRAENEKQRAENEKQRAEQLDKDIALEREARLAAEREIARLTELLKEKGNPPSN